MTSPVDTFQPGAPGPETAAPAEPPLTAADVVSAMTHVLRTHPLKAEPPIEPAGWSPFAVAAMRGLLGALLTGLTTFLATWSQTDSPKLLIIATGTAVVAYLVSRWGAEGVIDQARFERTRQ